MSADLKSLVGDAVMENIKNVNHALKLQKLVKGRIEEMSHTNSASDEYDEFLILQSLIEESEK